MHSLLSVKIIFPQNILHYPLSFSTFTWVALFQSDRIICWSVEGLYVSCVSVRRRPQMGFLEVYPSGGHRDGSRRDLNRYCKKDGGEQSISLLQMPVCCLALSCKRMTWFISLFVRTVRIRCSNFFNIRIYRSELTVAHLYKNHRCRSWSTAVGHVTTVLITAF